MFIMVLKWLNVLLNSIRKLHKMLQTISALRIGINPMLPIGLPALIAYNLSIYIAYSL